MDGRSLILAATEDQLVLRPSKRRWSLILIGSATLFVGSIFVVESGEPLGWLGCVLFGVGVPISLLQLFSPSNYLRLSSEGFTVAQILRHSRTWRWQDVGLFSTEAFYSGGVKTLELVTYELRPNLVPGHSTVSSILAVVGGRLPDTYGMKAKDLAALMNGWRERNLPVTPEGDREPDRRSHQHQR